MHYNNIINRLKQSIDDSKYISESIKKIINTCYDVLKQTNSIKPKVLVPSTSREQLKNIIKQRMPDVKDPKKIEFLVDILSRESIS